MAVRNGTVNASSSNTESAALRAKRRAAIDETNNPRKLITHQKKWKTPRYMMSLAEKMDELIRTPGETAREEILSLNLMIHDMDPSARREEHIESLVAQFELEREIEKNDPVSFDDAVSRARQDVDSLFSDITSDDIGRHFFSPLSNEEVKGRPRLEELKAKWMSRWIASSKAEKRRVDEWSKLIGFAGEYLVLIMCLTW